MLRELVVKEVVLVGLLGILGSGLAMQLRATAVPGGRLLFAPAFGLATASSLLLTINFVAPLRTTLWTVLVPLACVSAVVAVRTARRAGHELGRDDLRGALVAAALLVAGLAFYNGPLDARSSPGPVSYGIFDAPEYVNFYRGFANYTNDKPLNSGPLDYRSPSYDGTAWPPTWDLTLRAGWGLKWSHPGSNGVPTAVAAGLNWRPWRTQAPYMLAMLMVCALGAAGLARVLSRRQWWPPLLAGAAGGGPILYSLQADGSQGLVSGIALVPVVVALTVLLLERFAWREVVLLGVMLAGVQAQYPEILPFCVGGILLAVGATGLRSRELRSGPLIRRALLALGALGVLCLALSPRTAFWTVDYFRLQLAGTAANLTPGNIYAFSPRGLLSWLGQTRDFYEVSFGAPLARHGDLLNLVLPLALLLGPVVILIVRRPAARPLLAFAAVAAVYAVYARYSVDCTYCMQRTLLPLAPVLAVGVWVGVAEMTREPGRLRVAGTILGTAAALATGAAMLRVLDRVKDHGVMGSARLTSVLDRVERIDGTINLEGFDSIPYESWSEQPLTYEAVRESTSQRVSTAAAHNSYGGFHYTGTHPPEDDAFEPRYRFVLSRLGAVRTDRRELYRSGPMVLSRRAVPFDVVVARGAATAPERQDAGGATFVQPADAVSTLDKGGLQLWITGADRRRAYVRLILAGPPGLRLAVPGSTARALGDGRTEVCAPAPDTGALRILDAPVEPAPAQPTADVATGRYLPSPSIRLDEMRATPAPCAGRPARPR